MSYLIVKGGANLKGELESPPSWRLAQVWLLTALLGENPLTITPFPSFFPFSPYRDLLEFLGVKITLRSAAVTVQGRAVNDYKIPPRAQNLIFFKSLLATALVARFQQALVPWSKEENPQFRWLWEKEGLQVNFRDNFLFLRGELKGGVIELPLNDWRLSFLALVGALKAKEATRLINLEQGPEVQNFLRLLRELGAEWEKNGSSELVVFPSAFKGGQVKLEIDPRGGLFLASAVLLKKGEVFLRHWRLEQLTAIFAKLQELGGGFRSNEEGVWFWGRETNLGAGKINLTAYPAIAAETWPFFLSLFTQARGESILAPLPPQASAGVKLLQQMGAEISLLPLPEGKKEAHLFGPTPLAGTELQVENEETLWVALLAALNAKAQTKIDLPSPITFPAWWKLLPPLGAIIEEG